MPGTLLLDDWQKAVTERLQQHGRDAFQAVQQANQPPLQNVQAPSLPNPQIDPNQIIQSLQQHAQDAWQQVQQANQPPLQGVQVDPNEIVQRLQQHAQDALQAIDQNVQPIGQGIQQVVQPAVEQAQQQQAVQPAPQPGVERGGDLRAYARQAAQRAGIDPDIFERQIDQESGFNPTAKSPAGAQGVAQFMPSTAAGMNIDPGDPYASLDGAARLMASNLDKYGGDYTKALAAYNAGAGNVDKYGGIPPFEETQRYVSNILGGAKQAVAGALERGKQAMGSILPGISQFGDKQLTAAEAYAACGPAAAVRFAQAFGRNPTLREATDLAAKLGWTSDTGMAGLQSESTLFTDMGIPHRVVGADWKALAREASSGNPVTISTPGHYFTADSYDPASGAFHVGSSGTDLRGGAEWMTPEQMETRMGALQGGLAADNPGTPAPSPISAGTTPVSGVIGQARQAVQQGARAVGEGLQSLDQTIRAISTPSAVQSAAQQPIPSDVLTNPLGRGNRQQASAALTGQPAGGTGDEQPLNPVVRGVSEAVSGIQSPNTGNPVVDVLGTGASALGTLAENATTGLRNISALSELSRGALGQEQVVTENRELFDQQQRLVDEFAGAQARGDQAAMDRIRQEMDVLQAQLPDTRNRDVLHAAAQRNPALPAVETGANLAGAQIAAPLAAEGAPLAARALATAVDPATGLPSLLVRGLEALRPGAARILTDAAEAGRLPTAEEVAGQVQKMPGTAELAPVREAVPQAGSDLLQAMLEQAKQRGADPEKVAALQKQIDAFDPEAATRRVLGGAQQAQILVRGATTLAGAAAGGKAGYESTPEDALTIPTPLGDIPVERGLRTLAGAGLGAGAGSALGFRGPLEQRVLENLRQSGLVSGPAVAKPWRGIIPEAVDLTKQSMLSGPPGRIADVIGNTIELGRQPAALWMGGRGDDALAGLAAVKNGMREAAGNALSALGGRQLPALGTGVGTDIPRRSFMYRVLSVSDAFTRTLGEYQGMASEANRLLRDAGMTPSDPGAAAYLASHADDLFREGGRSGAQSVFGQGGSTATARSGLENVFRVYNNFKEGMLNSPDKKSQALGALLDFEIPFSGVPVRMVQMVARRTPPGTQIRGAVQAAQAIARGDGPEASRLAGETALESSIQFLIAKNIADGNIRGPDDPDHPNSIRMPGMGWVSMNEWGGYALPMQIMASFAEGMEKGGQNVPPSTPGASPLEQAANYYGPRFNAALNASMKPLVQAVPGMNMVRALSSALQGDATGASIKLAQDAVSRVLVPGAARFVENLTDPVARDVAKKGVQSLWEGPVSNWPGLAQYLPEKIDPTTGEPLQKSRSGAGALVGVQQDVASPLTIEAANLRKLGHDVSAPKTYADSVTVSGIEVKLSPDEQRKVAQITGKTLGSLADRIDQPDYQNSTDARKAALLKAYIDAADKTRLKAVSDVIGQDALRDRLRAGQQTAGRLNVQATPPTFSSSPILSPEERDAVGAGR